MIRATPRNLMMLMAALFGSGGGGERVERGEHRNLGSASYGPSGYDRIALGPPPWSKRLKRRRRRARAARQTKKARARRR